MAKHRDSLAPTFTSIWQEEDYRSENGLTIDLHTEGTGVHSTADLQLPYYHTAGK